MFSKVKTYGISGTRTFPVWVETDISRGIPHFEVVGLGSETVRESRKRVRSALANQGFEFPKGRVMMNLAPADVRKNGTGMDFPIAMGILCSEGIISEESLKNTVFAGELSLDGQVHGIKGILPMIVESAENNEYFFVPEENAEEAAIVPNAKIIVVKNIKEAVEILKQGEAGIKKAVLNEKITFENGKDNDYDSEFDFIQVFGQYSAKRALEIAAAGKHNLLLMGSPGCGKTMLANCFSGILPPMSFEEFFDVSKVYSSAGLSSEIRSKYKRPFRTIHPGTTRTALVGGGRPLEIGEVSLATNGVLFMDELCEVPKNVLEALRLPLEEKKTYASNYGVKETLPADFLFFGASNPCPCGNYYEGGDKCTCSPMMVQNYISRLSGAILDRIDIHVQMRSVQTGFIGEKQGEKSAEIRKRVINARKIQSERYINETFKTNGDIKNAATSGYCVLTKDAKKLLASATENYGLSVRGYEKTIKVARTIADLESSDQIREEDISEALQYRIMSPEKGMKI